MPDFAYSPVQRPASRAVKMETDVTKFGGGYQQRTKRSPNNRNRSWTLTYNEAVATIATMETFLAARFGTTSFTIDQPDTDPAVEVSVVVLSWRVSPLSGSREQLTATFTEEQWS